MIISESEVIKAACFLLFILSFHFLLSVVHHFRTLLLEAYDGTYLNLHITVSTTSVLDLFFLPLLCFSLRFFLHGLEYVLLYT
jgi:hypothetical protein